MRPVRCMAGGPTDVAQSFEVPVLLVIYRRPDLAARVFDAISAARPGTLFVAADGPASVDEAVAEAAITVTATITVATAIAPSDAAIAIAAAAPAAAPTHFGRARVDHRLDGRHMGRHRPGLRARTEQGCSGGDNGGAK